MTKSLFAIVLYRRCRNIFHKTFFSLSPYFLTHICIYYFEEKVEKCIFFVLSSAVWFAKSLQKCTHDDVHIYLTTLCLPT